MLCECGCGQKTRLAPHTDRSQKWVKGQPIRFINGHNAGRPKSNEDLEKARLKHNAQSRAYRLAHLEEVREKDRIYAKVRQGTHRDFLNARSVAWTQAHRG